MGTQLIQKPLSNDRGFFCYWWNRSFLQTIIKNTNILKNPYQMIEAFLFVAKTGLQPARRLKGADILQGSNPLGSLW